MFNGQCLMVNGQWIGWGLRPQPLVSDRLVASTTAIATTGITTSIAAAAALAAVTTVLAVLVVLDIAAVAAGYALQHVAILVETGDLDGGILQLVLDVSAGGEHDAAGADER